MSVALTSVEELEDLFSAHGVENHIEDIPVGNKSLVLDRVIAQATERVLMYLRSYFDPEALEENVWVREQATYIAAHLLSIRRGNPSLYGAVVDQALNDLALVRDGHLSIDVPSISRVVVQTPRMDSRGFNPTRFDDISSSRLKPDQRRMHPYYGNIYRE